MWKKIYIVFLAGLMTTGFIVDFVQAEEDKIIIIKNEPPSKRRP